MCRTRTSPSDEESVRRQYLKSEIKAPDLVTVKDFIRFYIATSQPVPDEVPTADSMNSVAEFVFAGFTRVNGTETDGGERREVYNVGSRTSVHRERS